MSNLPAGIDRAALDRVMKRASELQSASTDLSETMSEAELVALGAELGIPVQHVRQALLEERTRNFAAAPSTMLDGMMAPAVISAERVVQGTESSVADAIKKWLERNEHMVVQRATTGRLTFEPMDSFARGMRRIGAVFDASRAKPYLGKVESVGASIMPLEPGFCHVTLTASLKKTRSTHALAGGLLAGSGVAMSGIFLIVNVIPMIALVPIIPMALAGWGITRIYRQYLERAQLGIERLLDELERNPTVPAAKGAVPPGVPSLGRGVGEMMRTIGKEVRKALEE